MEKVEEPKVNKKKEEENINNINMNLLTSDFFERIKQQIKTELCDELFQRGKEQLFMEVLKAKTQLEQPKPKIIEEKEEKRFAQQE